MNHFLHETEWFHMVPPCSTRGELGVQPPVGFWDPLGLSSDGDVEVFKRRTVAASHAGAGFYQELKGGPPYMEVS